MTMPKILKPSLIYRISIVLSFVFVLNSCAKPLSNPYKQKGIYYWRTIFSLSDKEIDFVNNHDVKKIYVRFFDVDRDYKSNSKDDVKPNATLQFNDSIPERIEIIPTVYITTGALDKMQLNEKEFAEKIYKRIKAMCRSNNIKFKEIQLDCDWSKSNRDYFFNLCKEMKKCLDPTQSLSSTIRLHQLTQTPPPVDKGVLMIYNTGNLMELTTENSIFSVKDIAPYLKDNRLSNYDLHLDVAYPTYGWSVVYYHGSDRYYFYKLLKMTDFTNIAGLKKIEKNTYVATEDIYFNPENTFIPDIHKGYKVRVERPSAKEILQIKKWLNHN